MRCAKCGLELKILANLWTQIGKKYITPVTHVEDKSEADKIAATGAIRIGDANTLVEGWYGYSLPNMCLVSYITLADNDTPLE